LRYGVLGVVLAAWNLTPLPTAVSTIVVSMMPIEHDMEIGSAYVAEAQLAARTVHVREVDVTLQHIADRLVSALPPRDQHRFARTFRVLRDPAINAFALPGGFIYVNSGLLATASSAQEVAGVLAHEMGHVLARHSQKRLMS